MVLVEVGCHSGEQRPGVGLSLPGPHSWQGNPGIPSQRPPPNTRITPIRLNRTVPTWKLARAMRSLRNTNLGLFRGLFADFFQQRGFLPIIILIITNKHWMLTWCRALL